MPTLALVTEKPWQRAIVIGVAIVVPIVCLLVGFALGENKIISAREDSGLLRNQLQASRDLNHDLEARLIDAELQSQVQREAVNELRGVLSGLHENVARLTEEVTFYKSLMAPNEIRQGLKVDTLKLLKLGEQTFQYELLVTQVALRRSYVSGDIRIDVVGQQDSTRVVKSLTDLATGQAYPLKFKFRYFQDLTGTITLPEGFIPEQVLVTALASGKEPLQVGFPWLVEKEAG